MTIIVKKAGILDTFQDCGRFGFRRFGINTSGAMDQNALRAGNILLGNDKCVAALEMHFPAPVLEFRCECSFVLTGGDFNAAVNAEPVANYSVLRAMKNDVLEFKKRRIGQRCYLSLKNGFVLDEWLDSNSTNLIAEISGFGGRRLEKGDELTPLRPEVVTHSIRASTLSPFPGDTALRFVPGPDYRDLTALSKLALKNGSFLIKKDSNRMGYRLEGPPLHLLDGRERISSAVTFGTIQLLPDNQLIILMADHQTTGGYPNLGTMTEADCSIASQLGPGDTIGLEAVDLKESQNIRKKTERDLALLKHGLRLRGAWN